MNTLTNIDSILMKLQELSENWAAQFENKPDLELTFTATADKQLAINGIVICPVSEVDVESSVYDEEFLYLHTTTGFEYEVYLCCPFNEPGHVGFIKRISTVYCAV